MHALLKKLAGTDRRSIGKACGAIVFSARMEAQRALRHRGYFEKLSHGQEQNR
jgi:hypothetical protein